MLRMIVQVITRIGIPFHMIIPTFIILTFYFPTFYMTHYIKKYTMGQELITIKCVVEKYIKITVEYWSIISYWHVYD